MITEPRVTQIKAPSTHETPAARIRRQFGISELPPGVTTRSAQPSRYRTYPEAALLDIIERDGGLWTLVGTRRGVSLTLSFTDGMCPTLTITGLTRRDVLERGAAAVEAVAWERGVA
jgi:hypothetical protein